MSREPVPKKRKKKVDLCPNPLFVQWLTEWRDEAASQGKKTQYAFGKALYALKRYPMLLKSGKEAKILDNFGDKICNMLDHKLAKYIAENGEPTSSSSGSSDRHTASSSSSSSLPLTSLPPPALARSDAPLALPVPAEDGTAEDAPRKRRPSNRGPKEYVPLYRSGPYALILTLYRHHKKASGKGFMLKSELQLEARPLSEKSFTLPDPGSHYTAWSSMSTLISKGFVSKEGSPARYSITDAGCQLANKLETVGAQFGQSASETSRPIGGDAHVSAAGTTANQSRKRKETTRPDTNTISSVAPHPATTLATHGDTHPSTWSDKLEYWYIDDHGKQVISKDDAAVTVDDEISIGFLIKASETLLRKSGVRYKRDYTTPADGCMVYAYLHNDDASDFCPIPTSISHRAASTTRSAGPSVLDTLPQLPSLPASTTSIPPASKPKRKKQQPSLANKPAGTVPTVSSRSHSAASGGQQSSSSPPAPHGQQLASDGSQNLNDFNSQGSVSSARSMASGVSSRVGSLPGAGSLDDDARSATTLKEPPVPMYVLDPGTFDIVLCVDSCETAGGVSKSRKQLLLPELQKNGVLLDVRKLQVGDFLWIAREKRVPVPGMLQMPAARELVLDYVVERKRMDDLCGSITDGRFKEQKFRLKQCGLHKPIYLIEDFGSIDHLSIPASTLRQATVNTQVVDGFFVKHTRDNKESAAYLTIMTRYLQGHYSSKTLKAYRLDDLEKLPGTPKVTSRVQKLLTFGEVNQSSIKNKNTTVTETFAKQLLQFSGLTAEKALAITQRYQTPSDLLDAYKACAVEKDRDKLLAYIKYGKLQRNVGPVLSKLVHLFYCTKGPLL